MAEFTRPAGPDDSPPVLALVRDLLFVSKITGTAKHVGVPLKVVREPDALAGATGRALIVDLNLAGAIEAAAAWKEAGGACVVGFVSHVDTATIQKARAAGVDRVMARSQFVQALPDLIGSATGSGPTAPDQAGG